MKKRKDGRGSVTKTRSGRYWARAPRQTDGSRPTIGVYDTKEEAERELRGRTDWEPPAWDAGFDWWHVPSANLHWRKKDALLGARRALADRESPEARAWIVQYENECRLERHLTARRRATEIRAYVAEIRAVLKEFNREPPRGGVLEKWIDWCEGHATSLDPFEPMRAEMRYADEQERRAKEATKVALDEAIAEVVHRAKRRRRSVR